MRRLDVIAVQGMIGRHAVVFHVTDGSNCKNVHKLFQFGNDLEPKRIITSDCSDIIGHVVAP
jgi:hypothetical protein